MYKYSCDSEELLVQRVHRDSCPCCGEDIGKSVFLFDKNGFTIYRCSNCESEYVKEVPSPDELGIAYSESYYNGAIYEDYSSSSRKLVRKQHYEHLLDSMDQFLDNNSTVLELGSATGDFLDVVKSRSMKPVGVEVSSYSTKIASEKGHIAFTGTLEQNIQKVASEGPYDAVFLHDVFEHLPEPAQEIQLLSHLLKQNGIIYLNTLNVDSPTVKYFSHNWSQYVPPFHLYYPTKKSLQILLAAKGFDIISHKTKGPLFYDVGCNRFFLHVNRFLRPIISAFGLGYAQVIIAKKN